MITSGVQMDWMNTGIMYTLRAVSYKDPPAVLLPCSGMEMKYWVRLQ